MRILLWFIIIVSSMYSAYAESDYYYRIQKDDSITVVLYSLGIFPVWDELPRVLKMNQIKIQDNPDYVLIDQKIILPKPNPAFEANYKILADGEIIILSKIQTQKQKEDFLNRRGLKEVINKVDPKKSVIALKEDEEAIMPRQIKRVYINYGLLINTTSSEQQLPSSSTLKGTNSLQSANIGASLEMALELKHHLYFDFQKFTLPTADSTMFSRENFELLNFSYFYGIDLTRRINLLLGLNFQEKVFFTDITQNLIKVNKASFIAPSIGAMYIAKSRFMNITPRLMGNLLFRPEKNIGDKIVKPGLEYNFMIGGFYNLNESSHLEFSIGGEYSQYMIDDIQSTDLSSKFLIKYGHEFFF